MKAILIFLLVLFSIVGRAQSWNPVAGHWQYQFMKLDSMVLLPFGNTAARPAAAAATHGVRFNTDSSAFEYSDGNKWWDFAAKPPADFISSGILTGTEYRDTTIAFTCGNQTFKYAHYSLPQYIGFRIRVAGLSSLFDTGPGSFCLFEGSYTVFNSQTGELYILNVAGNAGDGYYYRAIPY